MGFVIDKQGNYLPVFGETTGGGSGTSNHSLLSNLDYAHSGHTGFMSNANYLPAGTKINVKTDGSGDYTTISDAVNYLTGKWSDGVVTIKIAAGTYDISSRIDIDGNNFNIPLVALEGDSNSTTILKATNDLLSGSMFRIFRSRVDISKIKVTNNLTAPAFTNSGVRAFTIAYQTIANVHDIAVEKYFSGIGIICSDVLLQGNNSFSYGSSAVESLGGGMLRILNCTNNISNYATGYNAVSGLIVGSATTTYTNVTNHVLPAALSTSGAVFGINA